MADTSPLCPNQQKLDKRPRNEISPWLMFYQISLGGGVNVLYCSPPAASNCTSLCPLKGSEMFPLTAVCWFSTQAPYMSTVGEEIPHHLWKKCVCVCVPVFVLIEDQNTGPHFARISDKTLWLPGWPCSDDLYLGQVRAGLRLGLGKNC